MNLSQSLNASQQAAVEYCDGPQLVIAGAGSGKTRVLTYKIAYLLQQGMQPWNILALTFTNKAANEMKERIGQLVGGERARMLHMGTFHSVFSRILRAEAPLLGYQSRFSIYDETDSRSLIKSIVKEMELDDKVYKPATVHNRISMAKNHLVTAEQYAADRSAQEYDRQSRLPAISRIYTAYAARLRQANAMDFDDLLLQTYYLFHTHEEVRQKYAHHFLYVLVDEYQDTNRAQQSIVLQLTKEHRHVCVVGDDAQSIYAFRGANIDNILNFQKIYAEAKLFKLEQNYRSTQHIVMAANSLIRKNERQIRKDVFSDNERGEKLVLHEVASDKEEALVVCKEIKRIKREEQADYGDFAILYRTNAQSRSFEEEMRKQAIPYRIYGGLSFYQRKEIKDVIAYFRLVTNPADEEALRRIINYPARGIGNTTFQKIAEAASTFHASYWEVVSNPQQFQLAFNKGTLAKLQAFSLLIGGFIEAVQTSDAYMLGKDIIKQSGLAAELYSGRDPESLARQENLEELMNSLQAFVEQQREEDHADAVYLGDFLQEVSLMTDLDSDDDEESRVSLMTVHAAKGLEFPTVFVVGMEEDLFPSSMSVSSQREIEEERRLFYVAITRAEKHCILSSAKFRYRYGNAQFQSPSRFLNDIDPQLLSRGRGGAPDFEVNRPYQGTRQWGADYRNYGSRMQNSRPVASQFMADVRPKATMPRQPETAVDPLSPSFKEQLRQSGGNLRRVADVTTHGGRTAASQSMLGAPLRVGNVIEHQRFGVGTVVGMEGTGENAKAHVDFKNAGMKQLLLKFAKYKILNA